ncbi:hypothetical protein DTO027B9_8893 [Paecilomyces variotii]|nr:hypothetical protein DTO027B9_8893 [Paecilomyces variotii]
MEHCGRADDPTLYMVQGEFCTLLGRSGYELGRNTADKVQRKRQHELFWGGFLKLSSEEFCPPRLGVLAAIWIAFSVPGTIVAAT